LSAQHLGAYNTHQQHPAVLAGFERRTWGSDLDTKIPHQALNSRIGAFFAAAAVSRFSGGKLPAFQGMPDASSCAGGELREIAVLRSQSVVARNTQQCLHIDFQWRCSRELEISSE
jgi:hypothetical protein